ncbi:unnamed protein product [Cuscuta campestris]|uniref:phospholipase D n=1 Tax=Cuscuta campestris TaxID=132261 RepID=A0A484NFZ8_9ASTE|nr:unnamed protein product [Cuscuta campestris]
MALRGKPAHVTINLGDKTVAKTTSERSLVWNQTFHILCAHPADTTTLTIALTTKCHVLGKFSVEGNRLLQHGVIQGSFPLRRTNTQKRTVSLQLMVWFRPAEEYDGSGFIGPKSNINSTFPLRSNCSVTLYQDAHHTVAFRPPFGKPRKLWEDIYKAIDGARHLVYIAGWSFNPNLVLVRDPMTEIQHARGVKLGELLKRKADEGVAVRIMLWDDETSLPIIKNKGVMRTCDEDSHVYFNNTKVVCRLVPRGHHKLPPSVFTHHQKTITVDVACGIESPPWTFLREREIMSFIGGFDLFDGRYDTEEHSLFRTLNTEYHCHDFYQTSLPGACLSRGGPREPWHDTHSSVLGQAALDILENFEQRWTKQCGRGLTSLVPISSIRELSNNCNQLETNPVSERDWKVQVLRSIDDSSTNTLPRNMQVERSIHEGYVEAIRKAERFVYIENQYFIGGSHVWEQDKDKNRNGWCTNLIPVEIALKIARKIRENGRFAAYIVIPMWPEGDPGSDSVQDILHWTRETMKMMYGIIGEAIRESGSQTHPRDYLNFFCLANREEKMKAGEFVPPSSPHPSSHHYCKAQKNRRFMVYVHSKLIIADDAYLVIGSANVNQRSMDGERDTEIAIGCYQSSRSSEEGIATDEGDIRAYRMSLWYEHTAGKATSYREFLEPQSVECVRKMRSIGDKMWDIYSSSGSEDEEEDDDEEVIRDMEGVHLASYPVRVSRDGVVEDLMETNNNGCCFPDTEAPIKGKRSKFLAPIITA